MCEEGWHDEANDLLEPLLSAFGEFYQEHRNQSCPIVEGLCKRALVDIAHGIQVLHMVYHPDYKELDRDALVTLIQVNMKHAMGIPEDRPGEYE